MTCPPAARRATTLGVAFAAAAVLLLVPAAAARTPCDDLLVTHRPGGSSGDTSVTSVTSQVLERGSDGWSSVSWDVASSVDVRTVVVESAGGARELPASQRTADGGIDAVHVCGTTRSSTTAAAPADDTSRRHAAAAPSDAGGGSATGRGLLGVTVGVLLGAVVLLLSHGARRGAEVPA